MRSWRELKFRLRQECVNLLLLASPPTAMVGQEKMDRILPEPETVAAILRDTVFAADLIDLAHSVLDHKLPLFGGTVRTGDQIDWRRDYVHGIETGTSYFRLIPYLNFTSVGDHKIVWEMNRHQHLVLLAQAFCLTGEEKFTAEIRRQIESWIEANPCMRGINWASALEVGFRALSWLWIIHLAGASMQPDFRRRFLAELYRHGVYLENNLSVYFSPNTHLLGEAVALHALGMLWPAIPRAREWVRTGNRIVREQIDFQVHPDGSHFEQSSYYHVYALDMFVFHYILAGGSAGYRAKLVAMAEYLHALLGPAGRIPMIGDDDGGRFFYPYGVRDRFGRATLGTCGCLFDRPEWILDPADLYEQAAWWIAPPRLDQAVSAEARVESQFFPHAGIASMRAGDVHVIVDVGSFGFAGAGHSHSDTLSLTARLGDQEILIDPGTFTYVADPKWRNWFRSSAAHNTVRIDQADQAIPISPFRWFSPPEITTPQWDSMEQYDFLDATCGYRGFSHRRRLLFLKPHFLFILDDITGSPGPHCVEQFFHAGLPSGAVTPRLFQIGPRVHLVLPESHTGELLRGGNYGWRSSVFGQREESDVIRVKLETHLPLQLGIVLSFAGSDTARLSIRVEDGETVMLLQDEISACVRFRAKGTPCYESA